MAFHWQLGTLADWISGIGSSAAAGAAYVAIRRDNATRQRLDAQEAARVKEQRRAQAGLIKVPAPDLVQNAIRPDFGGRPNVLQVYFRHPVINGSDASISDLKSTVRIDSANPAFRVEEHTCEQDVLLPHSTYDPNTAGMGCAVGQETPLPIGQEPNVTLSVVVEFRDARGIRWRKTPGSDAYELSTTT